MSGKTLDILHRHLHFNCDQCTCQGKIMQPFTRSQSRDPDRIRVSLEQLCENLKTRMGDELESIIAYGSFVRFG